MSQLRREFIQRLSLGGMALGALPTSLAAATTEPRDLPAPDLAAWRAEVLAADQQAVEPAFDVSWTEKLTGKYRAVFDTPEINGGGGVWRAGLWVGHYMDVLKAQPAELNPVIVIRHAGIPLAMNQAFWDEYDIGKKSKVTHPVTDKKTRRNPVLMTAELDGLPPGLAKLTMDKQQERGTIVLACNMAFGRMVSMVVEKDKLPPAEARTKALSMLAPGVILQPNGIFGVTLAQQHGCVFVQAA